MAPTDVIDLSREGLLLALVLGGPLLAVALIAGVCTGLLQAVTNVHEQSVSFVTKLIATGAAIILLLPWLIGRLAEYAEHLIQNIPNTL